VSRDIAHAQLVANSSHIVDIITQERIIIESSNLVDG